jgi:para-aminobenzoate synthetase component 1
MLDAIAPDTALTIRDIPWADPATAFAAFADEPHTAWLDSAPGYGALGRYSYLAVRPFLVLSDEKNPFGALAAALARWRLPPGAGPVPFSGGAIGFFGYGLRRYVEALPDRHPPSGLPDMMVGFYDLVLAFDHQERRAYILASGFPAEGAARGVRAVARADEMAAVLRAARAPVPEVIPKLDWRPEISRAAYESQVSRVLGYIAAGDIFQANFTGRFLAERPAGLTAADIYLALRRKTPAPFGAYIGCGAGYALLSASPERFVALDAGGRIETRPIKGTMKRNADAAQDQALRDELQACPKNRAENLMIVDLMRNDIGRVAWLGSVQVAALWQIESHKNLHHLVSVICATLRTGLGAVDLLKAVFPGGSVTGAPKIRAMEIIDELEVAARGAYCGAIAWIGFDGAMDSSIVIRTITATPDRLIAQAGGGIVAGSDPAAEYEEMRLKIAPLLDVAAP